MGKLEDIDDPTIYDPDTGTEQWVSSCTTNETSDDESSDRDPDQQINDNHNHKLTLFIYIARQPSLFC